MQELIVPILITLTVVTLVGHGIWCVLAFLVRRFRQWDEARDHHGPASGRPASPRGPAGGGSRDVALQELDVAARRVSWLWEAGFLEPSTSKEVSRAIARARVSLEEGRAGPSLGDEPAPETDAPGTTPAGARVSADESPPPLPAGLSVPGREEPREDLRRDAGLREEDAAVGPQLRDSPRSVPAEPRSFADTLTVFMERKNIRWFELIGGLLVVASSGALVINLWSRDPVLKFALLTGVTASLFGVGLYAERRWMIPATSRGILILASLLVPLDFLALIAFSRGVPVDAALIGGEVVAAALFLALSWSAGRAIARPFALLYALGVVGPSVAMLILRRAHVSGVSEAVFFLLGGAPLAFFLATAGGSILAARRWTRLGRLKAYAIFSFLGVSFFAASLGLGLFTYFLTHGMPVKQAIQAISPYVVILGVPALACGTLLGRRLSPRTDTALRVAATSVAAAGVLVSLLGVAFSWPDPVRLLAAAAACGILLSVFAFLAPFPDASFLAGLSGILAYLLGFHLLGEGLAADVTGSALASVLFSGTSGNALIVPVVLFGALALRLRARGYEAHGTAHLAAGTVAAFLGVALAARYGFAVDGDPLGVTWTFSVYSVVLFTAAWALRERRIAPALLGALGTLLLLGALVQALVFRIDPAIRPELPLVTALLLHLSATVIVALVLRQSARPDLRFLEPVLRVSSWLTIVAASLILGQYFLMVLVGSGGAGVFASRSIWLALGWLGLAFLARTPYLVSVAQLSATLSAASFALSMISGKAWFASSGLSHPWSLQTIGIAVGLVQLAASTARQAFVPRLPVAAREILGSPAARIDKLLLLPLGLILVLLLAAGFDAAARTSAGVSAAEYFASGSWLLWGVLIAALVAAARERAHRWAIYSLLAALWLVSFLIAGQGAEGGWALPGLEWSLAIFFLATAGLLGSRHLLGRLATGEWAWLSEPRSRLAVEVRSVLTASGMLPLAIAGGVGLAALEGSPPETEGALFVALGPTLTWALPVFLLSVGLLASGVVFRSRRGLAGAWLVLGLAGAVGYAMRHGALDRDLFWPFARELFAVIASVWSVAGLAALARERMLPAGRDDRGISEIRRLSSSAVPSILVTLAGIGLVAELAGRASLVDAPIPPVFWIALLGAALLAAAAGILYREERSWRALFALAIAGAVAGLDALDLRPWEAAGCLALVFAFSGVAAGALGRFWIARLSQDAGDQAGLREFFLRSSVALSLPVVILSGWMALVVGAPELGGSAGGALLVRLLAAAPLVLAAGGVLAALSRARPGESAVWSLSLLSLAPVVLTWGWIEPGSDGDRLLHRAAALAAWSAVAGWVFGIGALRPSLADSPWKDILRRALLCQAALFATVLLVSVGVEALVTASGDDVEMHPLASLAVSLASLSAAAGLVVAALLPSGGPFDLPEGRLPILAYLAEGTLATGFAHLRLTMPWLFRGFFTRYWPFVVMGLAYAAVALGARLRRRGVRTLSEPLDRTGLYLPLAPILGFLVPSEANYALVFLLAALLYATLSLARRSFLLGLVASLAASVALWHFYLEFEELTFRHYPQLWVVPLPLSVLIASYVHRAEIPPDRLASLRYACLGFIYLTSTAEIFIDGVEASPSLPLLLAFWSVLGVVAGALARVQSFLFTGSAFLLVAVVAMIWHASEALHWNWLWYVAGIALGLAIIAAIALFEKKRADLLRLLGGLRNWER